MFLAGSIVSLLNCNFLTLVSFFWHWRFTILLFSSMFKIRSMRPLAVIGLTVVTLAWLSVGRSGRENKTTRPLVVSIVSWRKLSDWLDFCGQSWRSQKIMQNTKKLMSWQSITKRKSSISSKVHGSQPKT